MMDRTDILRQMLRPRSIAIIGASTNFEKLSGRPLDNLLKKGYKGSIYPINPKCSEIAGLPCYSSIDDLPEIPELALVLVPAIAVSRAIEDLGRLGVRSAVVLSSGFGETGEQGKQLERQLAVRARELDLALCGPNSLGFINALDNVYATFSQYANSNTGHGPIAFVTQSGAFGTAISELARQRGLGLGYFINTGNQADITFSELMLAVAEDPRIRVMAGYLEGVSDGQALVRLAKRCQELNKPLVLIKVGRKKSGARAAASHTGSLAVEDTVFDAVIRQYGVIRARNEEQTLDILEALCQERRATGRGVGIITQSGGAGVMMSDRAEDLQLDVPRLSDSIMEKLISIIPSFGAAGNPVDITGQFVAEPHMLEDAVVSVLDDPNIHVAVVWLQLMTTHVDLLVDIFSQIQQRTRKPFLVCWVSAPPIARRKLQALGIPVFGAGERAVEAAGALITHYQNSTNYKTKTKLRTIRTNQLPQGEIFGIQPSVRAIEWLTSIGVPMADALEVQTEDQAVEYWRRLDKPIALKIESPDIQHKTEVNGIALNLNSEAAIRTEYRKLLERITLVMPDARIRGVLVQAMAYGDVELAIGARRDPVFGMIVMVGLGGILIEILKDIAFRQAPFDELEGLRMLEELKASALLDGVRGRAGVDRRMVARLLSDISVWAKAMEGTLVELDLNPIMCDSSQLTVVDCLMICNDEPLN